MLVHIYNYAYSFGAGRRREIKEILILPDCTKMNRRVGYHNVFITITHCEFATRFYAKNWERERSPIIFVYVI